MFRTKDVGAKRGAGKPLDARAAHDTVQVLESVPRLLRQRLYFTVSPLILQARQRR